MKLFKPNFWHRKNSLISFFLQPISIFYKIFIMTKKKFTKKKVFSIPIICVGNIYLGGTGKTPLCIDLVMMFKKLKKKTAIIKKSYKDHEDEFKLIQSKEIELIKEVSRIKAIKKAELKKFDCVILDDGFQDSSIFKNLNIICFNGEQLAGNEMVFPAGPLREPFSSLKDSQIVVINGDVNKIFEKKIQDISKDISIYYSEYLPENLNKFSGQNLLAFAGIGNPNNFFNLLEKNNLHISKKIDFPDHYNYSLKELNDLIDYGINNNLKIITTEKDYFRIQHHNLKKIEYLSVQLKIKNNDKFEKEVMECIF